MILRVAIGVSFRYGRGYGLGREGLYTANSSRWLTLKCWARFRVYSRRRCHSQHLREQRTELEKAHKARQERETQQRARSFSTVVRGVWDWMTGKHVKIRRQNEQEALLNWQRDRAERERLVFKQI